MKAINELWGMMTNTSPHITNPVNNKITQSTQYQNARNTSGIMLSHCHELKSWQRDIVTSLKHNNGIYVIASPSAGKTEPMVCYWAENILKINPLLMNSSHGLIDISKRVIDILLNKQVEKLVYLAPIRRLVEDSSTQFYNFFADIIIQTVRLLQQAQNNSYDKEYQTYNRLLMKIAQILKANQTIQLIDIRKNQFNRLHTTQNDNQYKILVKQINNLDNQIIENFSHAVKTYIIKNLVSIKTKASGSVNPNALVIICVYQSAPNILKLIKNIHLIIFDESHLIQKLKSSENEQNDLTHAAYSSLFFASKNNIKISFLTGTLNPVSAYNFAKYINKCLFNKKIKIIGNIPDKNSSDISVIVNESINSDAGILRLLLSPSDNNNVIVLFSKKRINTLINKALNKSHGSYTIKQIDNGIFNPNVGYNTNINTNSNITRNINIVNDKSYEIVTKIPEANEIHNQTLRKAVSIGIGFIYRMDEPGMTKNQLNNNEHDLKILSNLFSQKKIHTLLTTDSIGIGVNFNIKNLYIPVIQKFTGHQIEKIEKSALSQLLNRTGRRAFNYSTIYTTKESYDDVIEALAATPKSFENRINIKSIINNISCIFKMFKTLYYLY